MENEKVLEKLEKAVVEYDVTSCVNIVNEALDLGISPPRILNEGLAKGLKVVGDRFAEGEAFLAEMLSSANCVDEAFKLLKPHLERNVEGSKVTGKIVIGTVKGDIHDIGKNIVVSLLLSAGFEVYDLGTDVPPEKFAEKAREVDADLVASSALLTTTRIYALEIEKALIKAGMRNKVKTMIGGLPTSQEWADEIGADGWAKNAVDAIEKARELLKQKAGN